MTRAVSIHIGLNKLKYQSGELGKLKSCENDADEMEKIAAHHGFVERTKFPTKKALKKDVVSKIDQYTKNGNEALDANDFLLITFSGHGTRTKGNEYNTYNEAWCLYDKEIYDYELIDLWTSFNEDVRILVISDSCFSGSIINYFKIGITEETRFLMEEERFDFINFESMILANIGCDIMDYDEEIRTRNKQILSRKHIAKKLLINLENTDSQDLIDPEVKSLPFALVERMYEENQDINGLSLKSARDNLIEKYGEQTKKEYLGSAKATLLLLAACDENSKTLDGKTGEQTSQFTDALLYVWKKGKFTENNYSEFRDSITNRVQEIRPFQNPVFNPNGKKNSAFENDKPFNI